jgi:hypothetical protein
MNKQRIIFSCAGAILFSAILFSCKKDVGKIPVEPAPVINKCDTITYAKHIRPIITQNCLGCHGDVSPFAGFSLNNYDALKAKAVSGRLKAKVIDGEGGFMPKDKGKMPQPTLDLISCWLNNGYKP